MKIKRRTQDIMTGYALILPAMIIISVFSIIPIIRLFIMSFEEYNMLSGSNEGIFIGINNFQRAFKDRDFINSVKNTLYFAAIVIPVQTFLALVFALLVNQKIKFKGFFRTTFYLPVIISFVVVAIFWRMIYDPMFGLANSVLNFFGIPPQGFLADPDQAMLSVIVVSIWKSTGWYMLIFLSGLQDIPRNLYEVAAIDGAGKFRSLISITLPLLRRTFVFVLVMTAIDSLKIYTPVYVMTGGNPLGRTDVVVHRIWLEAFRFNDLGYASALSVLWFVVILSVTLVQIAIVREKD